MTICDDNMSLYFSACPAHRIHKMAGTKFGMQTHCLSKYAFQIDIPKLYVESYQVI